jgi:hypothetical protein
MSQKAPSPRQSPQPPKKPDWLRIVLIVGSVLLVVAALIMKIPEHQAEIIKVAIVLITKLVEP